MNLWFGSRFHESTTFNGNLKRKCAGKNMRRKTTKTTNIARIWNLMRFCKMFLFFYDDNRLYRFSRIEIASELILNCWSQCDLQTQRVFGFVLFFLIVNDKHLNAASLKTIKRTCTCRIYSPMFLIGARNIHAYHSNCTHTHTHINQRQTERYEPRWQRTFKWKLSNSKEHLRWWWWWYDTVRCDTVCMHQQQPHIIFLKCFYAV